MAQLDNSAASLRIGGDDLDPAEITRLLGCEPSLAHTKGQELVGSATGRVRIARIGTWMLDATDQSPEDLDGQIAEVLGKLTGDLEVWRSIAAKYEMDFYCGLFMQKSNEGLTISPQSLAALGLRQIELGLDIYGGDREDEADGAGKTAPLKE